MNIKCHSCMEKLELINKAFVCINKKCNQFKIIQTKLKEEEWVMSDDMKDMLERAIWTFVEAFIGALTISPLVGVDANALQLAAISGGGAALAVIKTYAKKKVS